MKLWQLPLQEIRRGKGRSWLTLIGVTIGIAAVIALITLGQGLQTAVSEQFSALGTDVLIISAKGNTLTPGLSLDAVKLTKDDQEAVDRTLGVAQTAGMIYTTAKITFNDQVRYFFVFGSPEDPAQRKLIGETNSYKLAKGRVLQKGDNARAIVGAHYAGDDLFGKAVGVGDNIFIQDKKLKVVGFWQPIGSPPDDRSINIPLDTYADIFGTGDELGLIMAQVASGEDTEAVARRVEKRLRDTRGVKEGKEDFSVETPQQLAGAFQTILNIVQAVLIGIACISLIIGGVGIMNTMYTAVYSRTKQIGVMKALGAQRHHILGLFIIEAGLYGAVGGVLGILIGTGLALSVGWLFVVATGAQILQIQIQPWLLVGAFLFSFIVGCLAGLAPAAQAARLHPVDALRYE